MDKNSCSIKLLPHGRKIKAIVGERLLESLIAHNIFLRSDCGGKGVCGKCRVKIVAGDGTGRDAESCCFQVADSVSIEIPESSLLSSHIIAKPPVMLPASFLSKRVAGMSPEPCLGIAVDLGTTTIAIYLFDVIHRKILSSTAVKNPQALYGDDVMNRIGEIGEDDGRLFRLQELVVRAIEWGTTELLNCCRTAHEELANMVIVGNPTMIHILLGISPMSIGIAPYQPSFFKARQTNGSELGLGFPDVIVNTLDQVSGFIGGDILAASLATELEKEPVGTLLIDLGTNGELLLKGKDSFFATSCATGPAFEGASLSCGIQAIPGAIDRVSIAGRDSVPEFSVVKNKSSETMKPSGLCGSGVISAVAAMIQTGIVTSSGRLIKTHTQGGSNNSAKAEARYLIVPAGQTANNRDIFISQKDIRSVQLGKAALITGIEFLLRTAGMALPEKIIIAGAFGSHLQKRDMRILGMLPDIDPDRIDMVGNAAGGGAIMALCDDYVEAAGRLAGKISVIELASSVDFQNRFVERLSFSGSTPVK